jgi:hypothetical protein
MTHKEELIACERDAVAAYLRRFAEGYRRLASNARADSSQDDIDAHEIDARRDEAAANALENIAPHITKGLHWR